MSGSDRDYIDVRGDEAAARADEFRAAYESPWGYPVEYAGRSWFVTRCELRFDRYGGAWRFRLSPDYRDARHGAAPLQWVPTRNGAVLAPF